MGGCGDGGCDKGGEKELIQAVLTCDGNISDPDLPLKLSRLVHNLQVITKSDDDWLVRKVEPWNSVRVTFSIPKEAAVRLHQLAQAGDAALQQLGILSVQVEGDQIVSLKVAGPNNETTEILIRTESGLAGPSGESGSHSNVGRSVTQTLGGSNMLPPSFSHQLHKTHPTPQFRSPSVVGSDSVSVVVGRLPMVQQRPQGPSYTQTFSALTASPQLHVRHIPQQQPSQLQPSQSPHLAANGTLHHSVGSPSTSHVPAVVSARPVFPPTNPPPPYPSQEIRPPSPQHVQQISSVSQINGQQYVVNQTINNISSVISNPSVSSQLHTQINSVAQPVTVNYRVNPSSHASAAISSHVPSSRVPPGRTQVNMVKNSPLLVGLLQQPDQTAITGVRNLKNLSSTPQNVSPSNPIAVENGPLPTTLSNLSSPNTSTLSSTGTYIGRSRDGLTTHQQIFSGGSVITNSHIPPPPPPPQRHQIASGSYQQPQPGTMMTVASPGTKLLQHQDDQRRTMVASQVVPVVSIKTGGTQLVPTQGPLHESNVSVSAPLMNAKLIGGGECHGETSILSHTKKESQYLINPNTGLLEPRPTTDSSDSETEMQATTSAHDEQISNSIASDEESNLSNTSRKETDHSDSDVSRMSSASVESRKLIREKSCDKESSPISWENNIVSSNPGEKIKLRLKLGREQVTQATIVGNAKQVERREPAGISNMLHSVSEPRVPKLHIKLHSSQPVIVKAVDETDSSNRLLPNKDGKEKVKRNRNRSKLKTAAVDMEPFKSKFFRMKSNREKIGGDDIASQVMKILEPKRTKAETDYDCNSLVMKFKDNSDMRLKVPRLQELSKPSSKIDNSKLRTRLKKPPMRKIGDLNSVGEITSHKILETLPPSITKVAAMHTQHPHCNPSSLSPSSPVPLSSITPSLFSTFPLSSSSTNQNTSNDQLKAELEKRGSEIIHKSEVRIEGESDILMTKVRLHPQLKGVMNGDIPHIDKLSINSMRYKRPNSATLSTSTGDFASAGKMSFKRQRSDEIQSLETLKKEGLGTVPTFLNSSVLINKVSSDKTLTTNIAGSHLQSEDFSDKFLGKVGGEIAGLKSNSDITIHSLSKKESQIGLSKGSDLERRPNLTIKPKSEVTKIGRVTCVDVMDRKALEEALKSSRNSSKKSEVSFSTKSTSSMVDRLRRWNSIDSSSASVPFSSHSQQQAGESTNLYSMGVRVEPKESAKIDCEKQTLGLSNAIIGNNKGVANQVNTVNNVNILNDCDNSGNDGVDKILDGKTTEDRMKMYESCSNVESHTESRVEGFDEETIVTDKLSSSIDEAKTPPVSQTHQGSSLALKSRVNDPTKIAELMNPASILKTEVDSPEGTPKGEHGNGQGGEDSGIESMDALSEKSPNHSDQSPNRREEKDSEVCSQDKCKVINPDSAIPKLLEGQEKFDDKVLIEDNSCDSRVTAGGKNYFQTEETAFGNKPENCFSEDNLLMKPLSCETKLESDTVNMSCDHPEDRSCVKDDVTCSESQNHSASNLERDICTPLIQTSQNKNICQENIKVQNVALKPCEIVAECSNEEAKASDFASSNTATDLDESEINTILNEFHPSELNLFALTSVDNSASTQSSDIESFQFDIQEVATENISEEKSNNSFLEVDQCSVIENKTSPIKSLQSQDSKTNTDKQTESTLFATEEVKPIHEIDSSNISSQNFSELHSKENSEKVQESIFFIKGPEEVEENPSSPGKSASHNDTRNNQIMNSSYDSQTFEQTDDFVSDPLFPVTSDIPLMVSTSGVCSTSIAIPTTTICITSPKCSFVMSPSVSTHCSPVTTVSAIYNDNSKQLDSALSNTATMSSFISSKPSVVAISVSHPTGTLMAAQLAPSMSNSVIENITPVSLLKSCALTTSTLPTSTSVSKNVQQIIEDTSSPSVVYGHSVAACNNNSLAYSNSYSTNTTSSNATMIILAASSSNSSSVIGTQPNSTKVVTLKPGSISQSANSSLSTPVGKTFRLVALPGINSMNPASSAVKGQLVTLKPVIGSGIASTITKVQPQLLQTLPIIKSEESINSPILKAHLSSPLISTLESTNSISKSDCSEEPLVTVDSDNQNSTPSNQEQLEVHCETDQKIERMLSLPEKEESKPQLAASDILSPPEEEPRPMRVHPPLYTYGNRERKKEVESDADEKEKDDVKENIVMSAAQAPLAEVLSQANEDDTKKIDDPDNYRKLNEKNLDALTIEIPNADTFPEDKRLTRSARQTARLASPKINSPGELSPHFDKKNASSSQIMCRPSPVGVLRSSTSPALRGTKRRRHESESSSTSTLSEDLQEPSTKLSRRKQNDKSVPESKDEVSKNKITKPKETEFLKINGPSSDEESLNDEDSYKKHNPLIITSGNDDDDHISRSRKNGSRSRDRSVEDTRVRDTTPSRRTPRQSKNISNVCATSPSVTTATVTTALQNNQQPTTSDKEKTLYQDITSCEEIAICAVASADDSASNIPKIVGDLTPKESDKKIFEKRLVSTSGSKEVIIKALVKGKKEFDNELETLSGRRKTRSTTNNTGEDAAKRRRVGKDSKP